MTTRTPIELLRLDERSYNALLKVNIKTIEELQKYSVPELLKIKRLGKTSVTDILTKLALYLNQ